MEPIDMETEVALALIEAGQFKRQGEDSPDAAGGFHKRSRVSTAEERAAEEAAMMIGPVVPPANEEEVFDAAAAEEPVSTQPVLQPFPYFYYRDFSKEIDPDPLSPLTPPGRVPNFPAKMHAILSRSDLSEIICWMPHGRSWRVLKPREFEVRVIPTYFEHAKFSSFIRQANGWGFRRVTQGRDRNCYYHELFLRGLPYLCKQMKRPAVAEKQAADPDLEPDFYKISEENPLPEKAEDETILLHCTIQGGPKARMPIYTGSLSSSLTSTINVTLPDAKPPAVSANAVPQLTPRDHTALTGFQEALGASEMQLKALTFSAPPAPVAAPQPPQLQQQAAPVPSLPAPFLPSPSAFLPNAMPLPFQMGTAGDKPSPLAAASRLAFTAAPVQTNLPDVAAAQFAAGFAAATALSQHQLRSVLSNFTFIPRMDQQQPQQQQQQPQPPTPQQHQL